jgi:glycosyltransferase involved in cell wall biosynthesis
MKMIKIYVDRKFDQEKGHTDSVNKITALLLEMDEEHLNIFEVVKPPICESKSRIVGKLINTLSYLVFQFRNFDTESINLYISEATLNFSALISSKNNFLVMHGAEYVSHPELRARSRNNLNERLSRWLLFMFSSKIRQYFFVSHWAAGIWMTWMRQKYSMGCVIGNPILAYNDIAVSEFRKKQVLYVGNTKPQKNLNAAIESFKMFRKSNPEYLLKIVGPGHKSIDEDGIEVEGLVAERDLHRLYATSEILLFPSLVESFGMPTLEAMSYGTKVVTSEIACLPEITRGKAFYCDPCNLESIVEALELAKASAIKVPDAWIKDAYSPASYYRNIIFRIKQSIVCAR